MEPLVVSSHGFSFPFYFILEISKITNTIFSMFLTSLCFIVPFSFHFFVFFPFHSFKYWRTFNTHVNQSVNLLSPPVLVDSTRFSLYAIRKVSRKPKHTHFNFWFQNIHFLCAVFPRSNFGTVAGMGTVWFHIFVNLSSFFLVCRLNF